MHTFHIVALGPPASGKTVYLAALHHVLFQRRLARGITVKTDPAAAASLERVYRQAADPTGDWPEATRAVMREFTFTISVDWTERRRARRTRHHSFPVFDISYIDYAGEWIPDADLTDPELYEAFHRRLQEAHSLLGIIDGVKLLQYLENDPAGHAFLEQQIRPIVEIMEGTGKPVHFVITKWDLFARYTLAEVGNRLLEQQEGGFRALVESRTAQGRRGREPVGTVRLIPVSSVGGLAALRSDWSVSKHADRAAEPTNVEIPLVAAVADVCGLALDMLRHAAAAAPQQHDASNVDVRQVEVTREAATGSDFSVSFFGVRVSLGQLAAFALAHGQDAVKAMGKPAKQAASAMRAAVRRVRARGLYGVRSRQGALFYVADRMSRRLVDFEHEEPRSLLVADRHVQGTSS